MIDRVHSVIVGKNVSRTASLVIYSLNGSAGNLAEGEVFVADKNKKFVEGSIGVEDTDTIYIGVGLGSTVTYADASGNSLTTRRIKWSAPIMGKYVKSYVGTPYTARAQQSSSFTHSFTPVAGKEYVLRIIYKDMVEHPGQFTHTYRYIATSSETTSDALFAKLAAVVNKHSGRRVSASNNSGVFTLTALAIPESTTSVNDIDPDIPVHFVPVLASVESTGWVNVAGTWAHTPTVKGAGNWFQVRDREKAALGYQGVTNQTLFPVKKPDINAVVGSTYHTIIIESEVEYKAADDRVRRAPVTVEIFIPSAAGQLANVVSTLNSYMGSVGKDSIVF